MRRYILYKYSIPYSCAVTSRIVRVFRRRRLLKQYNLYYTRAARLTVGILFTRIHIMAKCVRTYIVFSSYKM